MPKSAPARLCQLRASTRDSTELKARVQKMHLLESKEVAMYSKLLLRTKWAFCLSQQKYCALLWSLVSNTEAGMLTLRATLLTCPAGNEQES